MYLGDYCYCDCYCFIMLFFFFFLGFLEFHNRKFVTIPSTKVIRLYSMYGIYWAGGGHLLSLDPSMEDFEAFVATLEQLTNKYE